MNDQERIEQLEAQVGDLRRDAEMVVSVGEDVWAVGESAVIIDLIQDVERATITPKEAPDAHERTPEAPVPEDARTSTDEPEEPRRDPTGGRSGCGEDRQGADGEGAEGQPRQAQLLTAESTAELHEVLGDEVEVLDPLAVLEELRE